mgnify:CR=1 FL=1
MIQMITGTENFDKALEKGDMTQKWLYPENQDDEDRG